MDKTKLREISVMTLTNGSYSAKLMKADRLKGEGIHGLPHGTPIMAIPIHCLPGVPDGWVKDPGSYVIEVDAEHGLWFDWTDNDEDNVAIVPTVKGMNPITGMKTEDVGMHQYREQCPKHHIPFAYNYYCEKCEYCWPPQNYISDPNILWWDGFRQPDGTVRQFFFTEEDERDVADAIIGKKNTIPAFGFAFYRCKNERRPIIDNRSISILNKSNDNFKGVINSDCSWTTYSISSSGSSSNSSSNSSSSSSISSSISTKGVDALASVYNVTSDVGHNKVRSLKRSSSKKRYGSKTLYGSKTFSPIASNNKKFKEETAQERFNKDVSVGAGAKIRQSLDIDATPLDEWGENPEAVITLYFVFSEQLEQIIEKGGIKKLENKPEGYLENVPVG